MHRLPVLNEIFTVEIKHLNMKNTYECVGFDPEHNNSYCQIKDVKTGHVSSVEKLWFDEAQTRRKITWHQLELFPEKNYINGCWEEIS